MILGSTPLEDFLADAGSASEAAERLQRWGLTAGIAGVMLAVGGIAFLAAIASDRRDDERAVQRIVVVGGLLAAVGGAIEVAGVARLLGVGWDAAVVDELGHAPMMRLVGGALVGLGFIEALRRPGAPSDGDGVNRRWVPDGASAVALVGGSFAALSFGFDGHSVTEGPRIVHAAVNVVHVLAAGAWAGGLVALAVVAWRRRRDGLPPRVVHSFSSIATASLFAVTVAGVVMTLLVVDGFDDITGTAWGRRLLIKVALVGVTASIGANNRFRVLPALDAAPDDLKLARRARTSVTVEVVVLAVVVVVTGLLATASTN